MMYVLIGMSLLFVTIGFIVTENNAKYLLSGYNTMSEEERKKVDIKAYIPYFRKFHIFLGVSFFLFGTLLTYLIHENAGGIFLGVYPILAYIYFIWTSSTYFTGVPTKGNKIGVFILVGTLIFVIGLIGLGFKEDKIIFNSHSIEFKGSYGEVVTQTEIQSIELVDDKPKTTMKTNGFALGTIQKGYFKTDKDEIVKLILNSDNKPYLLLTKSNGTKIYFSAKEESNEKLLNEIKKTLPDILYKK
ncbi:DUF3784 domain-containing protein [Flavobacterium gawalongense]|uniref:DUF3784 domain-containing protein n=1 Tax=Flavobacterium gawalongense TaxID=2594432 RepID=A0A553BZ23_9FLAO|nr:DUF3784 domain-containing protein [Flavobacterium gawalongense]TRX04596.1 DUF3784 domain-containing protein [Flavobacterium gawalongense]TRX10483.1 DUF3784 domain-containing protein [Flavobacterium gawalongense]TRX13527.1 DUF3784 domain-containing protein [Flavobacterium gawalongense]TRX15541.1 DUF3784 domain-containing protein [Flavobacterium gawalongense]TRX31380.1 DUF3784 domain-containing protein [Flavobacterium gawalongense]